MSDDRLGQILSAQPWRLLCALHEETPRPADPILRAEERLDGEAHVTLCYELHHVVLPGLAADGVVTFDSEEGTVGRGPQFEIVRPLLSRPPTALRRLDAGPFSYDETTGTVRYDPGVPLEQLSMALDDERGERHRG